MQPTQNVQRKRSVVVETTEGFIIDHACSINQDYNLCIVSTMTCMEQKSFVSLPDLFAIHEPFRMDSQYQKTVAENDMEDCVKKRKRKAKHTGCSFPDDKLNDLIKQASLKLVAHGVQNGVFLPAVKADNNRAARQAAAIRQYCPFVELCLKTSADASISTVHFYGEVCVRGSNCLVNTLFINNSSAAIKLCSEPERYIVPANCRFLMSDITGIHQLCGDCPEYDLIVIDPPWENKSAKRKKTYSSLSNYDLYKLPMSLLTKSGCVIAVWVTNKQKQKQFVRDELFKHWNIQYIAEWHWVKVTTSGHFIHDIDSMHKKPYEHLILGRYQGSEQETVPDHKIILSVPCSIHSRKPHLKELLEPYLSADAKCLELFARNLQAGWTSWGNEVLKFQHMDFFTECIK